MKRVHLIRWASCYRPDVCEFALCGRWTKQLTTDREESTCPRCIARYDAEALARADRTPKP